MTSRRSRPIRKGERKGRVFYKNSGRSQAVQGCFQIAQHWSPFSHKIPAKLPIPTHSTHSVISPQTTEKRSSKPILLSGSFLRTEHKGFLESQVLFQLLNMLFPLEGFGV